MHARGLLDAPASAAIAQINTGEIGGVDTSDGMLADATVTARHDATSCRSIAATSYANVDFALAKTWTMRASQLEFQWEIFNLLNRANFDLPNRIFGSPNFDRIFSAREESAGDAVRDSAGTLALQNFNRVPTHILTGAPGA